MILVTGGRGAGKRSFVTDVLGFSPEQFAEDGPVLYGLEELDPLPPLEALLGPVSYTHLTLPTILRV